MSILAEYRWYFLIGAEIVFWLSAIGFFLLRYGFLLKKASFIMGIVLLVNEVFILTLGVVDYYQTGKFSNFQIITVIILALIIIFLIYPSLAKVPNVVIPDVSKMTVIDAEKALRKQGFEVANDVEYIGDDEIEKGLVVKTSPSIGREVKKGTEIILYESTGKVAYTVENYVGKNYIEIKTILTNNYGLNVVIEKMEPEDGEDNIDPEKIIKQDIEVGTKVAKGTNITLYIPEVITKYPDFTDGTWTKSRIEDFCKENEVKCTFKKVTNTEERDGTIISQSRPKGDKVAAGADLTIKIAEKEVSEPSHDGANN